MVCRDRSPLVLAQVVLVLHVRPQVQVPAQTDYAVGGDHVRLIVQIAVLSERRDTRTLDPEHRGSPVGETHETSEYLLGHVVAGVVGLVGVHGLEPAAEVHGRPVASACRYVSAPGAPGPLLQTEIDGRSSRQTLILVDLDMLVVLHDLHGRYVLGPDGVGGQTVARLQHVQTLHVHPAYILPVVPQSSGTGHLDAALTVTSPRDIAAHSIEKSTVMLRAGMTLV